MGAGVAIKKQLLAMAANSLARECEFDDMSVDMICQRAQVSRSTFYRLFQSKYDILIWCELIPFTRGIAHMGRSLTCLEGVMVTLECFNLFEPLFLSTRHSTERMSREDAGRVKAAELIRETLAEHQGLALDDELDFQITWFARALLDQCVLWSKEPSNNSLEDDAALVASCCPVRLRALFDHPAHPQNPADFRLQNIVLEGLLQQ